MKWCLGQGVGGQLDYREVGDGVPSREEGYTRRHRKAPCVRPDYTSGREERKRDSVWGES